MGKQVDINIRWENFYGKKEEEKEVYRKGA